MEKALLKIAKELHEISIDIRRIRKLMEALREYPVSLTNEDIVNFVQEDE